MALAVCAAELGVRLLSPRERSPTPAEVDLRSYFSEEEIMRGRRFARPQLVIGLSRASLDLALLCALVQQRQRWLPGWRWPPVRGAAADAACISVASALVTLPHAALARRRAIAVGLVTQTWRGWVLDLLKASALQATFSGAAGGAVIAVMRRYPRGWWLPAAGGSVGFGGLLAALSPVLLDPIFNDFEPLPEGERRADVLELAAAAGVKVGEVYSIDASRRTTAANAYVTGLGPTKRVVLFDTLLDRYDRDEVRVVVAHELAHVRHRDVARSVAFAAIVAGPAAFAVKQLTEALGDDDGTAAALPALALAAVIVSGPIGLIANRLSRSVERRADAYSLSLSGAPEAFIAFDRKIAIQNVADIDPPRWVSSLLGSHPPTRERIGAAVAFSQTGRAEPAERASI